METGLAGPPRSDGTIRLHRSRINGSSDEENADLPLTPVSPTSSDLHFITIPDTLISSATLIYLGFTKERAEFIWNQWTNWPYPRETDPENEDNPRGNMLYIEVILLHFGSYGSDDEYDTYSENNEEWTYCMDRYGINDELKATMMDPRFNSIRLTNSCLYWLRDTIEERYFGLEDIQAASYERQMAIQRPQEHLGGSQYEQRWTIQERAGKSLHTSTSRFAMEAGHTQPGHIKLFKGISQRRLKDIVNPNDGSIDTSALMSYPQTDFLSRTGGGYFAVDRDMAVRYANWAKHRVKGGSAAILQITIPNSAIESLPADQVYKIYWDPNGIDKTWEKVIYYSRNGKLGPKDLRRLLNKATLIIGTIATGPNHHFGRMRSYEEIRERDVMKDQEGRPAIQYVWHLDGEFLLEQFCCESLQVFPVTVAELSAFNG